MKKCQCKDLDFFIRVSSDRHKNSLFNSLLKFTPFVKND